MVRMTAALVSGWALFSLLFWSADGLAPGWKTHFDGASGKYFYFNEDSRERAGFLFRVCVCGRYTLNFVLMSRNLHDGPHLACIWERPAL